MNLPVAVGRRKTLELEEQLTVAAYWEKLCERKKTSYTRYQLLHKGLSRLRPFPVEYCHLGVSE